MSASRMENVSPLKRNKQLIAAPNEPQFVSSVRLWSAIVVHDLSAL